MKIYHILDHYIPHYSGYTFRTKSILAHQKRIGIEPTLIISPKYSAGLASEEVIDGMQCFRSTSLNGKYNFPCIREYYLMRHFQKDILRLSKDNPPDLIHAHSPLLNGFPALRVARKLDIPIIYEVRALWEDAAVDLGTTKQGSLRYLLTKSLETNLLKKVDAIVVICEGLKKEFIGRGIKAEKIYVVPNGVDAEKFKPLPKNNNLIKQYNLENKIVLGFIGSFYKYEGLSLLIEAMPKILSRADNVVLMLIGQGNEDTTLKQLAREKGIEDKVIFTGQVPNAQIADYYSLMDILVYPRENIWLTELTTPLKPLEAMAMEKAVIGSDVGGIKELVEDGKTGLLFKAGNAQDLADKCIELISNPQKRQLLGQNGREYVLRERNWETILKKHLEIYTELLEKSNAKSN